MRDFEVIDVPQGSAEWLQARAGLVTGSNAAAILMGKTTAGRRDYLLQLAVERIKGEPEADEFTNRYIEHGKETEPMARIAVEERLGAVVQETGFLRHKKLMIGASLDGHIGNYETTVEIKCPKSTTHVGYLTDGKIPPKHLAQVMHGIYVTGATSAVFASYDDRMPEGLELLTVYVQAKDLPIENYEKELLLFLKEVEDKQHELLELREKHGKG